MNLNSGMAFLSVAGQTYPLVGEFSWDPGQIDRETQKGMDGVHGQKLSPRVPFISMTLRDNDTQRVADLNGLDDANIFCQLISNKTVTGSRMWQVGPTEVNSEEGTYTVRFEGIQGAVREGSA